MKIKASEIFTFFILTSCVFLIAGSANARTWYVSNSGNDSNSGTQALPWLTIAKVNRSSLNPGDQILFERGGIWREELSVPSSGNAGKPIIFGAYGTGNKPVISGADIISGWSGVRPNIYYAAVGVQPHRVFFDNALGTRRANVKSLASDKDWTWFSNILYVYSASPPTGRVIEASQRPYAIIVTGRSHLEFVNLELRYGGLDGFLAAKGATYITIDRLTSRYNYWTGIKTSDNGGTVVNRKFVIRDSVVDHNGGSGMLLSAVANSLIHGNLATNNAMERGGEQFDWTAGIRLTGTDSVANIIENNECSYQGNGVGIWLDFNGSGNIIRFNKTHHNGYHGIFNEITSGTEIYGNVSYDNAGQSLSSGIYVEGRNGHPPLNGAAVGNKVYNNTIYGNGGFGLMLQNGDGIAGVTHDNVIKNNIITGTLSGTNLRVGGGAEKEYNVFDHNILGTERWNFIEWGWRKYKSSYASWEAAYGRNTNSLKVDPQFVNPLAGDFSLKPTSPCIDAGINLGDSYKFGLSASSRWPHQIVTLDRNECGAAWDIGAYEYTGGGFPSN